MFYIKYMNIKERVEYFTKIGYTYDPITGDVKNKKGNIVGGKNVKYKIISTTLNNKTIQIGQHIFGYFCQNPNIEEKQNYVVDHIDRDTRNNRIENLRYIIEQKNNFNRKNTKGCCFVEFRNKWMSYIKINSKFINLGYYDTYEEAHLKYLDAKKIYHKI